MPTEEFINAAVEKGSSEGIDSLDENQRLVFLISEAESLCDMEGIDCFLNRYQSTELLDETATSFEAVGATKIAKAFREYNSLLERLNDLITRREGYGYDSIEREIKKRLGEA